MQRNEILENGAMLYVHRKPSSKIYGFRLIERLTYINPQFTGELWKCYDEESGRMRSQSFYTCENIDKIL